MVVAQNLALLYPPPYEGDDMKQNFKNQFQSLRNVIQGNVATLKELIEQSSNLSQIIEQIRDTNGDANLKAQLEETRKKIMTSIEELVAQNQTLFETYEKLIEEVFGK